MKSKEYMITSAMLLLITYTLTLSLVSQAFPAGQTRKTLSSTGAIQIQTTAGIGVYSDSQCYNSLSSMSWGTLQPGGSQSVTCYIKNEGNSPTTISLQTSNWNPASAENYLTLSWDYDARTINPTETIQVTFTLNVDASIEGVSTFSFDITIIGSS